MTDETVECFNCGRANPAWAQVCRSCGVPLKHGATPSVPVGRFPTDRESLISIGAVIGTILAAVLVGVVLANVNPTDPSAALDPSPTQTPTAEPTPIGSPSATPVPASPSPVPTPPLPGTVAFGTGYANGVVSGGTDTFAPGDTFAHSITMTEPFGVPTVNEQVVRVEADGTETELVAAAGNGLNVDPAATVAGAVCCDARVLIAEFGPGTYILRVFREEVIIAQGQFVLAEG